MSLFISVVKFDVLSHSSGETDSILDPLVVIQRSVAYIKQRASKIL